VYGCSPNFLPLPKLDDSLVYASNRSGRFPGVAPLTTFVRRAASASKAPHHCRRQTQGQHRGGWRLIRRAPSKGKGGNV